MINKQGQNYPKEFYVPLDQIPWLEGLIVINRTSSGQFVEILLVYKESKKIFRAVESFVNIADSERETIDNSIQKLSSYLNQLKH